MASLSFGVGAQPSPSWSLDASKGGWHEDRLALQYFHHSEMQRQWAWHLLGRYPLPPDAHVLDFGCGDGKITAELSHFLPEGHIVGMDLSPSMLRVATRCFPQSYYPNLFFSSKPGTGLYDLICAFSVFHLISDPIEVLKSLSDNLIPHGQLWLVIPCGNNPAFFQAATETLQRYQLPLPWASSPGTLPSSAMMRTQEGCIHCLNAAGFQPISVTALHTPTAFFNKEELIAWMIGTVSANWQIPLDIADRFFSELVDRMAALDPEIIDSQGCYSMKLSRLEVIAQKI